MQHATARWYAAFLAAGGLVWTALLLRYAASANTRNFLIYGISIVAMWSLRALNIGGRPLWIGIWIISTGWHLLWSLAGLALAAISLATFRLGDGLLASIPAFWVFIAFSLSIGGLIADISSSRDARTKA